MLCIYAFHPCASGYHNHQIVVSLNTIKLLLRLLGDTLCTVLCSATENLCVLVESCLALGVLRATCESLLAIHAASGTGVLTSSGVCRVGFAATGEGVEE